MKKVVVLLFLLISVNMASAQLSAGLAKVSFADAPDTSAVINGAAEGIPAPPPQRHFFHGKNMLSFAQVSYNEAWDGGGVSNVTLRAASNLSYTYKHHLLFFQSVFDGAYAMTWDPDNHLQKKEDRFQFTNSFGVRTAEKSEFYYTALVDLKSQFAPGYKSPTDQSIISRLFSPAYLTTSLGMSYKHNDMWDVTVAPLSGRFTFVLDTTISKMNLYTDVKPGDKCAATIGFYASAIFKAPIVKNYIAYYSKLELFSNYMDSPQNIDVDWENKLDFKITNYLAAQIYCRLVYKDKSRYKVTNEAGVEETRGPRLQINESFNIGLTYNF